MELKRILAKDTRAAMDLAMSRYGKDVLVVSSQNVGDQVELVVALDVAPAPPEPPAEAAKPSAFNEAFKRALGPMPEEDGQQEPQDLAQAAGADVTPAPVAAEVPRTAAEILAARKARQAMQTAQAIQAAQKWQLARASSEVPDPAAAEAAKAALAAQAAKAAQAVQAAQAALAAETARAAEAAAAARAAREAEEAELAEQARAAEEARRAQEAMAVEAARAAEAAAAAEAARAARASRAARTPRATRGPRAAKAAPVPVVPVAAPPCPPLTAAECAAANAELHGERIMELVRKEIAALRQEFALSRQVQAWQEGRHWPEAVLPLVDALQDAGVPAGLRAMLSDELRAAEDLQGGIDAMRQVLQGALTDLPTVAIGRGLHAICGPSGAGKTHMVTRLARVAALHLTPARVAIITFNDSRSGAWSQSRVLAAQAGVDCFRAGDASTLRLLVEELRDRAVVLIDTTSADCQSQAEQLRSMDLNIETHLLLPADSAIGTVKMLMTQPELWRSLMVSKVDESHSPWPVLQSMCDRRVPLSCMSQSADIQNQARPVDARRLLAAGLERLQLDLGLTPGAAATPAAANAAPQRAASLQESAA